MITVIESKLIHPRKMKPKTSVLYIRREIFSKGRYKEFTYLGPTEEVEALAKRAVDADMEKIDDSLRQGNTFDAALKLQGL